MRRRDRRGDIVFDAGELLKAILAGLARFLSSAMATSFSIPSSGTDIATQRPRVIIWIVASMSSGEWLRP